MRYHAAMEIVYLAAGYLVIANIAGFALMGADKKRARKGARRVPEKTLFLTALLGGGMGATLGMYAFRHKTRHWYFVAGMPALAALNLAVFAVVLFLGLVN